MIDIYLRRNTDPDRNPRVVIILVLAGLLLVGLIGWLAARKRPLSEGPVQQQGAAPSRPIAADEKEEPYQTSSRDLETRLIAEAKDLKKADRLQQARERCLAVLAQSSNRVSRAQAEALLNEIHITLAMTPRPMPEKEDYTIRSGDTLGALAKKFGTTIDLIKKANTVSGSLIRTGDRYRILQGTYAIRVDKSDNELVLYLNDRFFKRYKVGTGKYQKTPVGNFTIVERIAQPTWWRPDGTAVPFGDPENVLGTHWLSLDIKGYGIHGTWEPDTIGQQASEGCIRLINSDIEELYTLVPRGTQVTITE